jgi:large subunit ribosomal protein L6
MSRIGKLPIKLPQGVTVTVNPENLVSVKGPKGELLQQVDPNIKITVENDTVVLMRANEEKEQKSKHGLYRSLLNNMVTGVSNGYEIKLELVGVGYRAEAKEQLLQLSLGFSHDIYFYLPKEIKVQTVTEKRSNPIITLSSNDKQLIGQIAAKIRSFREPEPYKGKGVRFVGEVVRRKAGKSASASK